VRRARRGFLTTHHRDEADPRCDRLAIIDHGRIGAEGSPDDLERRSDGRVGVRGINQGGTIWAVLSIRGGVARHRGVGGGRRP
jgi:ABC-type multidrug transport system ATPase subunit